MKPIRLFLFPDICPEEEACIRSCVSELQKSISIQEIRVSEKEKGFFKKNEIEETSWIVARDWQRGLRHLSAFSTKSQILVSVLSTQVRKSTLWETWFQSLNPILPAHIKLLAHSPLSYRFLKELAGIPDLQLEQVPFPVPGSSSEAKNPVFTVGVYCSFLPANNLHFLLTIAHYVAQKDPSIQFKFWGRGDLSDHLVHLAKDLGISQQVQLNSISNLHSPESCDVSLYFPQKNDHFSSLLIAASVGAVPICGTLSGIENYVRDSETGFVFQPEEMRSIAELILTLKNNPSLCLEIGGRFRRDIVKSFSSNRISGRYLSLFNGNSYQTQNYIRHAL